jgi:cell division inhibitor SepF
MASMWRRAMVYLGLVDEPEDDDEAVSPGPRQADAGPNVRPLNRDDSPPAARPGVVRTMPSASTAARVHVVEPRGFNDAQEVGDRLKANQPVILNLQGLERDLQRRLIDFSSGLAYALGGSMSRVADQVFLLTPSNVEVSQEEKERLQARGLFRA